MKTIPCNECGKEIPKNFIVCPHCKTRCVSKRKLKTSIILAFSAGFLGTHNFYMGYYAKAITEAFVFALSLVFLIIGLVENLPVLIVCGIFIFASLLAYAIGEGIMLLKHRWSRDRYGKKLS